MHSLSLSGVGLKQAADLQQLNYWALWIPNPVIKVLLKPMPNVCNCFAAFYSSNLAFCSSPQNVMKWPYSMGGKVWHGTSKPKWSFEFQTYRILQGVFFCLFVFFRAQGIHHFVFWLYFVHDKKKGNWNCVSLWYWEIHLHKQMENKNERCKWIHISPTPQVWFVLCSPLDTSVS